MSERTAVGTAGGDAHGALELAGRFATELRRRGFDLCATLSVKPRLPGLNFDFAGASSAGSLGVLVGNTKRLWPAFTRWRDAERARGRQLPHPLNRYVERSVETAAVAVATKGALSVYYSHLTNYPLPSGEQGALPIQRLAALAGMAALSPAHLSVHPRVGPWLALRALVIFECPWLGQPQPRFEPCRSCLQRPCEPALRRALAGEPSASRPSERWIAVRDACPIGSAHRYESSQLSFHYSVLDDSAAAPRLSAASDPDELA